VNPLVFRRKTTILYGDGGQGKSTFALLCAMLVSTGQSVAGIRALPGRALFLDYEDDEDVHIHRLHALQAGHPELLAAEVLYQRCVEPLTQLVHPLVRKLQAERISFLVLDSLIAATGGDASAEGTAKLFAALRRFNCEILAVGHIAKTQGDGHDQPTIYGSVFNKNLPRSTWEFKTEHEVGEDTAIIGLFNQKVNLSRKHSPIGLKVTQNEDNSRITYEPFDLSQAADLAAKLPLPNRIRNLLEDGELRSAKEIADDLEETLAYVKTTLSKHGGTKWHKVGENRGAKWTVLNR
jgi:RecA-family ATPase